MSDTTTVKTGTEIAAIDDLKIVPFDPKNIKEFGNSYMATLVMQAALEETAERQLATAKEAKTYLGFEMTRAIMDLATREENPINVHAIFGKPNDVARLNQKILVELGVMERTVTDDDEIIYKWTQEQVQKIYDYNAELKDEDEAEYTKRFNNRKRLNIQLSNACKSACILVDNNNSVDDLSYSESSTGELVPTISNAPKEISGESDKVQLGSRKAVAGATMSPTMTSLVKLASNKHKPKKESKGTDAGEKRDNAKMDMSDEDFSAACNTVVRFINAQEGKFSDEKKRALTNLGKVIADTLS